MYRHIVSDINYLMSRKGSLASLATTSAQLGILCHQARVAATTCPWFRCWGSTFRRLARQESAASLVVLVTRHTPTCSNQSEIFYTIMLIIWTNQR